MEQERQEPDVGQHEVDEEEGRTPPPDDPQEDPASNPEDENLERYRGG